MDRPGCLSPTEAYEVIQRIFARSDTISLTSHCRERAAERGFTLDDIRRVLVNGSVSPDATWKDDYQEWTYKISGTDYDLEPLILIVAIEERFHRITVITGMGD